MRLRPAVPWVGVTLVLTAMVTAGTLACSSPQTLDARLGGDTTRADASRNSFGLPAPELTDEERRLFEIGDSFFTQSWVTAPASTEARDGLGPAFNAQACSSCHVLDGRGAPPGDGDDAQLGLLLRLSVPGIDDVTGGPIPHPTYGDQLQDRAIEGVPAEGTIGVSYTTVAGAYGDGSTYELRRPVVRIDDLAYGPLGDDVTIGARLAPQVIGVGLLEAIPDEDLLAAADPDDADGDGISGRVNTVFDLRTRQAAIGRFGWKANVATVEQQVAGAFLGDIGITSDLHVDQTCTDEQPACSTAADGGSPELTTSRLDAVTFYNRTLSVPAMRDTERSDVRDGAQLFEEFACSSCHTITQHTGAADLASLSDQTIHPYTDLLLHDMGADLADGRPDFDASGSEWRTPPLWGIGLVDDVNGSRFLLHDGRARTFAEAILWHGGEGEASREAFRLAEPDQRDALLAFLEAL